MRENMENNGSHCAQLTVFGRPLNWSKLGEELDEVNRILSRTRMESVDVMNSLGEELSRLRKIYGERSVGMLPNNPSRRLYDRVTDLEVRVTARFIEMGLTPERGNEDIDLDEETTVGVFYNEGTRGTELGRVLVKQLTTRVHRHWADDRDRARYKRCKGR
jgi:hypothetical protein